MSTVPVGGHVPGGVRGGPRIGEVGRDRAYLAAASGHLGGYLVEVAVVSPEDPVRTGAGQRDRGRPADAPAGAGDEGGTSRQPEPFPEVVHRSASTGTGFMSSYATFSPAIAQTNA
jgi:hypothetical protein